MATQASSTALIEELEQKLEQEHQITLQQKNEIAAALQEHQAAVTAKAQAEADHEQTKTEEAARRQDRIERLQRMLVKVQETNKMNQEIIDILMARKKV